ncbi:MAG: hypothetical protein GEU79_12370 [Acidimicrobiia bacterium]|nr:hypothetical protein [Acidimicrobiia bacterium]
MSGKKRKKKVVRVEPTTENEDGAHDTGWEPTTEAKQKATRLRMFAAVLWLLAIAGEAFAIFWVLRQDPINLWLLVVLIVLIGALAIGGSLLWKQANRLDPATKKDKVRFFVQNQLGAIITVIAFVPLIVLIFLSKDLGGKEKAVAGGVGVAVFLIASFFGVSFDSPSTEQYDAETQQVIELTGENLVFWTKHGSVFHLCEDASAVNLESEDDQIYSGTVADAHADGMDRLTLQIDQEIRQCGLDGGTTEETDTPEPNTTFSE